MANQVQVDTMKQITDLGQTYMKDGATGVSKAIHSKVSGLLDGFDPFKNLPDSIKSGLNVSSILSSITGKGAPAGGGPAANKCGAAGATITSTISAQSGATNPLQATDAVNRGHAGSILDQYTGLASQAKKSGLLPSDFSVTNLPDGSTVVKQALSYAPQEAKNLAKDAGFDLSKPGTIDKIVKGAEAVGHFFGLW